MRTNKLWLLAAAGAGSYLAYRALLQVRRYYDLNGKVALVTGARGLGLVLARELGRLGARVALCARDPAEVDHARFELGQRGVDVLALTCDITDQGQAERLVRQVRDHFGRLDVLINNAGVIEVGPVETMTLCDYQEAMATHYWAPLYLILAALPMMRLQGEGRIVNISSIGGKVAVPHLVPYAGSKFALVGLSEGLRAELLKDNIYVTTVCPGLMRTGSPRNATFKGQHRAEYAWFSISDALPLFSISAERAAREILSACRRGEAEIILSLPAKAAVAFHGLFPGLTADILSVVNHMLPGPGGSGTGRALGRESESSASPSAITTLNERAAAGNNEIPGPSRATALHGTTGPRE
jgi:NAD(P)-dependent dehydrogenase (short-subunit alcohol dehydrogenase family)